MAPRLSPRAVARIENALREVGRDADRVTIEQLATNYNTSMRTIYYHKSRIERGAPLTGYPGGPTRILPWTMRKAIHMLLEQHPYLHLDEIGDFLNDSYGIQVSSATISRTLASMKVTKKRLRVEAAQRNAELRSEWRFNLQRFSSNQLVFVDEMGSDDRTGDRYSGWADAGARAVVQRWLQRKKRVSVLPAYTTDGYIAARTFTGTCTGDLFEE